MYLEELNERKHRQNQRHILLFVNKFGVFMILGIWYSDLVTLVSDF